MTEEMQTYSIEEVCEKLQVAASTVYKYAREGVIESVPNPYNVKPSARFIKSSVDRFVKVKKQEEMVDGTTIKELAEKFNIPRQRIKSMVDRLEIPVHKITSKGRPLIVLPNSSVQLLESYIVQSGAKHKQAKSDFYSPLYDVALFQKVTDSEGRSGRIVRKNGLWGIEVLHMQYESIFLPLVDDTGKQVLSIQPNYPIHQHTFQGSGYAHFKIPLDALELLEMVDYFYMNFGIENLYVDDNEDGFIHLHVKQHTLSLQSAPLPPIYEEFKQSTLVAGDIVQVLHELFIIPSTRRISAVISLSNYTQLKEYAATENKEMSECLEEILSSYFEQNPGVKKYEK